MEPCSRSAGGRRPTVNRESCREQRAYVYHPTETRERGGKIANEIERVVGWGTDSRDNYGGSGSGNGNTVGDGGWGMGNEENCQSTKKVLGE